MPDEQGRVEPPVAGDEAATLTGFLDYQRSTLRWKCAGLDTAALQASVGVSSMTLGGLLKHLAFVEDHWFTHCLAGRELPAPWHAIDWDADTDWDWQSAGDDSPEQLHALWDAAIARSREITDDALATDGPGRLAARPWPDQRTPSLRWVLCHMIEEYARHNGHADLIREAIDGQTGE